MSEDSGVSESNDQSVAIGVTGEWISPEVNYVNPNRRFCAFCGRPIARRYWQSGNGHESRVFCNAEHAVLYTTYPNSL